MEIPQNVLEILAVTIPLMIGMIFGSKTLMNRPKTIQKLQRDTTKLLEDNLNETRSQMRKYKNQVASMQRGPMIDEKDDFDGVVSQFSQYLPKWAQPLIKSYGPQLIEEFKKDPEKATALIKKLIKKPNESDPNEVQGL